MSDPEATIKRESMHKSIRIELGLVYVLRLQNGPALCSLSPETSKQDYLIRPCARGPKPHTVLWKIRNALRSITQTWVVR